MGPFFGIERLSRRWETSFFIYVYFFITDNKREFSADYPETSLYSLVLL